MIDSTQIFSGALGTGLNPPTGQAITATADSNVINMIAPSDMGAGNILGLHIDILQSFNTLTSLDIEFKGSSAAAGTYFTLLAVKTIPLAQLIAGSPVFRYVWPLNQVFNAVAGVLNAPPQFYKFVYTVNGANPTQGSIFAYVNAALDRNSTYIYPENYVTA